MRGSGQHGRRAGLFLRFSRNGGMSEAVFLMNPAIDFPDSKWHNAANEWMNL
jgi:hypothetical protein